MIYQEDDHCGLSNNLRENGIWPVIVGRNNWLFFNVTNDVSDNIFIFSSHVVMCFVSQILSRTLKHREKVQEKTTDSAVEIIKSHD